MVIDRHGENRVIEAKGVEVVGPDREIDGDLEIEIMTVEIVVTEEIEETIILEDEIHIGLTGLAEIIIDITIDAMIIEEQTILILTTIWI